jgi:hypothetical protein
VPAARAAPAVARCRAAARDRCRAGLAVGSLGPFSDGPGATLQELTDLNVGFVSLTEALDLTTSTGRAMAGMLAVFAAFEHDILRERVRAGLAYAKQNGKKLGSTSHSGIQAAEVRKQFRQGISKINEEDAGWDAFIQAAQKNLPGLVPADIWRTKVAQPPFATNSTTIYRKDQSSS